MEGQIRGGIGPFAIFQKTTTKRAFKKHTKKETLRRAKVARGIVPFAIIQKTPQKKNKHKTGQKQPLSHHPQRPYFHPKSSKKWKKVIPEPFFGQFGLQP